MSLISSLKGKKVHGKLDYFSVGSMTPCYGRQNCRPKGRENIEQRRLRKAFFRWHARYSGKIYKCKIALSTSFHAEISEKVCWSPKYIVQGNSISFFKKCIKHLSCWFSKESILEQSSTFVSLRLSQLNGMWIQSSQVKRKLIIWKSVTSSFEKKELFVSGDGYGFCSILFHMNFCFHFSSVLS